MITIFGRGVLSALFKRVAFVSEFKAFNRIVVGVGTFLRHSQVQGMFSSKNNMGQALAYIISSERGMRVAF
jgi:hypothetical protein